MSDLPPDSFEQGLAAYAEDLRAGHITAVSTTQACLDRIAALNPRLDAFQLVDGERALAAAAAIDALLAAGTDLGPLMGVPIGVKRRWA